MKSKFSGTINEAEAPMRVGVGALLIRTDMKILAASRKNNHLDLGLPGGKIEPGETEIQAVVRELKEETSIVAKRYHRIFAAPDAVGFWFITFLVYDWEGEAIDREGAVVRWVDPSQMLQTSCSFREYNRDLFAHLGILPRGLD
jgi:mutator protein MutT